MSSDNEASNSDSEGEEGGEAEEKGTKEDAEEEDYEVVRFDKEDAGHEGESSGEEDGNGEAQGDSEGDVDYDDECVSCGIRLSGLIKFKLCNACHARNYFCLACGDKHRPWECESCGKPQ